MAEATALEQAAKWGGITAGLLAGNPLGLLLLPVAEILKGVAESEAREKIHEIEQALLNVANLLYQMFPEARTGRPGNAFRTEQVGPFQLQVPYLGTLKRPGLPDADLFLEALKGNLEPFTWVQANRITDERIKRQVLGGEAHFYARVLMPVSGNYRWVEVSRYDAFSSLLLELLGPATTAVEESEPWKYSQYLERSYPTPDRLLAAIRRAQSQQPERYEQTIRNLKAILQ